MREHFEQSQEWFRQALFDDAPIQVQAASEWTDDLWFLDRDDRHPQPKQGWWPVQPCRASGRLLGGNLCTLNLLQGSPLEVRRFLRLATRTASRSHATDGAARG